MRSCYSAHVELREHVSCMNPYLLTLFETGSLLHCVSKRGDLRATGQPSISASYLSVVVHGLQLACTTVSAFTGIQGPELSAQAYTVVTFSSLIQDFNILKDTLKCLCTSPK